VARARLVGNVTDARLLAVLLHLISGFPPAAISDLRRIDVVSGNPTLRKRRDSNREADVNRIVFCGAAEGQAAGPD